MKQNQQQVVARFFYLMEDGSYGLAETMSGTEEEVLKKAKGWKIDLVWVTEPTDKKIFLNPSAPKEIHLQGSPPSKNPHQTRVKLLERLRNSSGS